MTGNERLNEGVKEWMKEWTTDEWMNDKKRRQICIAMLNFESTTMTTTSTSKVRGLFSSEWGTRRTTWKQSTQADTHILKHTHTKRTSVTTTYPGVTANPTANIKPTYLHFVVREVGYDVAIKWHNSWILFLRVTTFDVDVQSFTPATLNVWVLSTRLEESGLHWRSNPQWNVFKLFMTHRFWGDKNQQWQNYFLEAMLSVVTVLIM